MKEVARHALAFLHRWRARASSRRVGVALLYHEVADADGDQAREILPPLALGRLEAQVRHLTRHYRVVAPSRLIGAVEARRRWQRIPVALTFDDDLESHVSRTAPLLRRLGVPAAFFLSGASLDRPWRFWWQDLQAALDADVLPTRLPNTPDELVGAAVAGVGRAAKRLAASIEELPPPRRVEVATALRAVAGDPPPDTGLRAEGVQLLATSGFEVGFHTLRHDRLPALDAAELEAALRDGRAELEAIVGRRLTAISYPHGRADRRVADAARAAGFEVGFTGARRAVRSDDDPLLLPRIGPLARTPGGFAVEIARFASNTDTDAG